jgi:hypothetical protein
MSYCAFVAPKQRTVHFCFCIYLVFCPLGCLNLFTNRFILGTDAQSTTHYTLWTVYRSYFKGISANIELRMYSVTCYWPYLYKTPYRLGRVKRPGHRGLISYACSHGTQGQAATKISAWIFQNGAVACYRIIRAAIVWLMLIHIVRKI